MRVLLATDGSTDADASVDVLLGFGPDSGLSATVLAVAPDLPLLGSGLEAPEGFKANDTVAVARAIAEDACQRLRVAGHEAAPIVRQGNPVQEILSAAREVDAGVIVLGVRGAGRLRRVIAGSVSTSVARLAPAPVLLVDDPGSLARALVATDGSPGAERALETFTRLPVRVIERVTLLHVDSGDGAPPPDVESAMVTLRQSGVEVSKLTAHGNEVEEIVRVAGEIAATVIILGASQYRVDGEPVLGTTANGVLNRAPCSILIGR
jgi:nucleotide-binding universal stress UspA family protein